VKIKRIKQNGKVKLSKDVSLEEAVAEIQEILERGGIRLNMIGATEQRATVGRP
jgi:hypothetical protein